MGKGGEVERMKGGVSGGRWNIGKGGGGGVDSGEKWEHQGEDGSRRDQKITSREVELG